MYIYLDLMIGFNNINIEFITYSDSECTKFSNNSLNSFKSTFGDIRTSKPAFASCGITLC